MSKKFATVLVGVFTAAVFLTGGILTSQGTETQTVPDEVIIENSYEKDKKGPVTLTHKKHTEYKVKDKLIACAECHHVYEDGKNVWKEGVHVDKCSHCHKENAEKGEPMKLQNAFHKNCKDCHKELGTDKAPFKKCNDCHAKK